MSSDNSFKNKQGDRQIEDNRAQKENSRIISNNNQSPFSEYNDKFGTEKKSYSKIGRNGEGSNRSAMRSSKKSLLSEGGRTITAHNNSLLNIKKNYTVIKNDKTMLSNRIVMLRKEEEKLMNKIKNTRERAMKILEVQQRNDIKFKEKLIKEHHEEKKKIAKREKIKKMKNRELDLKDKNRKESFDKKYKNYQELKQQRDFAVKYKENVRKKNTENNKLKRNSVRDQENRIQMKLRKRAEDK